jgi:hypothetical protein
MPRVRKTWIAKYIRIDLYCGKRFSSSRVLFLSHRFEGEPFIFKWANCLANTCQDVREKLVIWMLIDTSLQGAGSPLISIETDLNHSPEYMARRWNPLVASASGRR